MTNDDRTIHAYRADGCQVVRYNRAGKWYLEWPPQTGIPCRAITLNDAVTEALKAANELNGYVAKGRMGGLRFDALFEKRSREPIS